MKHALAAVLVLGLGTPLAVCPAAVAEPLLIVPGAEYVKLDRLPSVPVIDRFYTRAIDIGRGFYPNSTPQIVDYPASMFLKGTVDSHVNSGATLLDAAIKKVAGPVVTAGQSQGAVVLDVEQARLQNDPNAPAADKVTFVVFGDPMRGMINMLFKEGTRIPFIGLTATPPVESRYNTVVVTGEYDLWGDPPDRPWNLLAFVNAMFGSTFVHTKAAFSPSEVPPQNVSVTTNSLGATTTTYFVPTQNLPLTEPLRLLGLPDKLVDALDKGLRPAIDSGYSRNDAPGSKRPYLAHGVIQRPSAAPAAVTALPSGSAVGLAVKHLPAARQTVSQKPSQTKRVQTTRPNPRNA